MKKLTAYYAILCLSTAVLAGCRSNLPVNTSDLTARVDNTAEVPTQSSVQQLSTTEAIDRIEAKISILQPQNVLPEIDAQLTKAPNNRTLAAYYVIFGLTDFVINSSWHDVLSQLKIMDARKLVSPQNAVVSSGRLELNTTRVLDQSQIDLYLKGKIGTLVSQLLNPALPKADLNRPYSSSASSNIDLNLAMANFKYQFASIYQPYFQKAIPLLNAMIAEGNPVNVDLTAAQLILSQDRITTGQLQVTDLKMLRALLLIIQGTGFYVSAYETTFLNNFYDRLITMEPVLKQLWSDHFGSPAKAFSSFLTPTFDISSYLNFDAQKVAGLVGANGRPTSQEAWMKWAVSEVIQTLFDDSNGGKLLKPDLLDISRSAFADGLAQMSEVAGELDNNAPSLLGGTWIGIENEASAHDLLHQVALSINSDTAVTFLWNNTSYLANFGEFFSPSTQTDIRNTLLPEAVSITNGHMTLMYSSATRGGVLP